MKKVPYVLALLAVLFVLILLLGQVLEAPSEYESAQNPSDENPRSEQPFKQPMGSAQNPSVENPSVVTKYATNIIAFSIWVGLFATVAFSLYRFWNRR